MWKQILPAVGFEPTTSCIRGKRLTARPRGPHGRERTTPRLIWNTWIFYKGTGQKTFGIEKRFQKTSGIDSISQWRLKSFQLNLKCRHFRRNNFLLLILRVFISFTKQTYCSLAKLLFLALVHRACTNILKINRPSRIIDEKN